jgi:YD repeat-containing protein
MNLVDAYVTKVLSEPEFIDTYKEYKWWQVRVEYNSYGRLSETELTFKTKDETEQVKVGYHFLT